MTRVVVVDDHPVVAQGVAFVLEDDRDLSFVGAARSAGEAVGLVQRTHPDVVLLDVRLPDRGVVATVQQIRRSAPAAAILLFTAHPSHPDLGQARAAGALAVLAKDTAPHDLRRALHEAASGKAPSSAAGPAAVLTARQQDVLVRVATGMTTVEIATELRLQPTTVKAYWQETMQRLNVRNRAEAIAVAYRRGLL